MREIVTKGYAYDELSDEAKRKAREWWKRCQEADPCWINEHADSRRAAMRAVSLLIEHVENGEDGTGEWSRIREESRACKWTGYTDDCVLYDNSTDDIPSLCEVDEWYESAWDTERDYMLSDESAEENIRANEYEFTEDGRII